MCRFCQIYVIEFVSQFPDRRIEMTTLSDYVDIGGECFNVTGTTDSPPSPSETNTTKSYDLVCKSRTDFYKTFGTILTKFPDALRLFQTYLPYQRPQLEGIQEHEKKPLKDIIEERMASLQASLQHTNRAIKNMQFDQYYKNLEKLLKEIDVASATLPATSLPDLQKRIKDKFKKERIYYVLMELAWYLLHPEQIKSNSDSWMKLLDTVETLNLGALVKSIHNSSEHAMKIDVDHVESATVLDASTLSKPDDSAELKKRLESILQLFVTRNYLKKPLRENAKGPLVNDETLGVLKSSLPRPMKGGANNTDSKNIVSNSFQINSESVANMMKPFYDFFKEKYDPITSVLSSALPDGLSLVALSKLLFICQKITSQTPIQHGIYRITNMDPVIMEFLRAQLGSVQAYVNDASRTDEDRKSFTDMAGFVPVVSIKSLLNRFGKSGHYTDPETLPTVRIMMTGINIDPYANKDDIKIDIKDDFQKEQIYQAASDFFTDQSIYLVCNEAKATQTSMNVFEVNYLDVNVSKNEWKVDNMEENYFNKFKEPPLFLEDVMDVKSNIVYNHGMLALSMFIASEELLPK